MATKKRKGLAGTPKQHERHSARDVKMIDRHLMLSARALKNHQCGPMLSNIQKANQWYGAMAANVHFQRGMTDDFDVFMHSVTTDLKAANRVLRQRCMLKTPVRAPARKSRRSR